MKTLDCPECKTTVSERDLRITVETHTREYCRKCGSCLRTNVTNALQMISQTTEDLAVIDQWLEDCASAYALSVQRHTDEKQRLYSWRAESSAFQWPILVRYQAGEAGHVTLTTICATKADDVSESSAMVRSVCQLRGLQFDVEIGLAPEALTPAKWWGAETCLLTRDLPPGLFLGAAARLQETTREALSHYEGKAP
jgi:hypothetical protein